jgi:hypothetical protein
MLCERCERYKAHNNAKRRAWRSAGLCAECGVRTLKYRRCFYCRQRNAAQKRKRRKELAEKRKNAA